MRGATRFRGICLAGHCRRRRWSDCCWSDWWRIEPNCYQRWERAVGAGLLAMQAPRYIRYSELMLSR
ncbi:hypothetical protein F0170_17880, partial [Pseudomonas sp. MAFF 730085]|nr:hypothetical protein [Pseudomonas kitaguniensis]